MSHKILTLVVIIIALATNAYPASAGPLSPAVTILSSSTEDRLDFQISGLPCEQVANLNLQVMGFRDTWNETWYGVSLFVDNCISSIQISDYSEDGRARFFLPDWTAAEVVNQSPLWQWNAVGGYYEQVETPWQRILNPGDIELPAWVNRAMGQNFRLNVPVNGTYQISTVDGTVNIAVCSEYPCNSNIASGTNSVVVRLQRGTSYLGLTTLDPIGGLSFVSFQMLAEDQYLPVISR